MQERKINSISEEAHNLALNTFITERQELLLYRQHVQNLEKALEEGRELNNSLTLTLKEAQERIKGLEEKIPDADADEEAIEP